MREREDGEKRVMEGGKGKGERGGERRGEGRREGRGGEGGRFKWGLLTREITSLLLCQHSY